MKNLIIIALIILPMMALSQSDTTKKKTSYYDYLPQYEKPSPAYIIGEYVIEEIYEYRADTQSTREYVPMIETGFELVSSPISKNQELRNFFCGLDQRQYYDMMADSIQFMWATDKLSLIIHGMDDHEQERVNLSIGVTFHKMRNNINEQFIDRIVPFYETTRTTCGCSEKKP